MNDEYSLQLAELYGLIEAAKDALYKAHEMTGQIHKGGSPIVKKNELAYETAVFIGAAIDMVNRAGTHVHLTRSAYQVKTTLAARDKP